MDDKLQFVSNNRENVLHLLAYTDKNYVTQLSTMLWSAVDNLRSGWTLSVFVLHDGLSEETKSQVTNSLSTARVHLQWCYQAIDEIEDWCTLSHISSVTYFRLLLERYIPAEVKRLIMLDSDLIVLGDLVDLWQLPLDGAAAGAVADICMPKVAMADIGVFRELGISGQTPYFNAGVIVVDMERWYALGIGEKAVQLANKYSSKVLLSDQCILNIALNGNWCTIPAYWNQQTGIFDYGSFHPTYLGRDEFEETLSHPRIVHFTTASKPWNPGCNHPLSAVYANYARRTSPDFSVAQPAVSRMEAIRRRLARTRIRFVMALLRSRIRFRMGEPLFSEISGASALLFQHVKRHPFDLFLLLPYVLVNALLPRNRAGKSPLATVARHHPINYGSR